MTRITGVLLGAVLLVGGCGIGNYSDEDLIFASALPTRDTVRLRVLKADAEASGTQVRQGLNTICEGDNQSSLTCGVRNIAVFFNTLTFGLIDLVDTITSNPPSSRERNQRIWGPYFDRNAGRTYRFEMSRSDSTFSYCLHVALGEHRGRNADDGVVCGSDNETWTQVLAGNFTPYPSSENAEPSARDGIGQMALDISKAQDRGVWDRNDRKGRGVFTFDYDLHDGRTFIGLAINDVVDEATGLPARAQYSYQRESDESGEMHLLMRKTLNSGFVKEDVDIAAQWNSEGAAYVGGSASGGDLPQTFTGWECSSAGLELVARHYDWDVALDVGTRADCPFAP